MRSLILWCSTYKYSSCLCLEKASGKYHCMGGKSLHSNIVQVQSIIIGSKNSSGDMGTANVSGEYEANFEVAVYR